VIIAVTSYIAPATASVHVADGVLACDITTRPDAGVIGHIHGATVEVLTNAIGSQHEGLVRGGGGS
jgi:hypothetical protein